MSNSWVLGLVELVEVQTCICPSKYRDIKPFTSIVSSGHLDLRR